jgi:CheY-like chemotaxis protein
MQDGKAIRVLVVDDEAVNRDVVRQMLLHFGHHVTAVDSGRAALEAVRTQRFDVVVMDCRMDDIDGLQATRLLRSGEAGPHGVRLPIIALTAQAFVADRRACLEAGMNDFLSKPVDVSDLVRMVCQWGAPASGPQDGALQPAPDAGAPLAATTTQPVFSPEVLAALPMVADGSQPGYGDMVLAMYLKSLPKLLAQIQQAASTGDAHGALHAVHSLKSSSAAVGALAMSACAASIESQLRTGHHELAHLPAAFERESLRLHAALGAPKTCHQESAEPSC